MDSLLSLVKGILIGVGALVVLLVLLLLIIWWLPRGNRVRMLMSALAMRLGATALAGLVAVPIEPIAGLDVLYDIGAPLILLIYWAKLFPQAAGILRGRRSAAGAAGPSGPGAGERMDIPAGSGRRIGR